MNTTSYNPNAIRRHLRHDATGAAKIYSMTRAGNEVRHTVTIDAELGLCECTCEYFKYRGRKSGKPCKHIIREMEYQLRNAKKEVA